MRVGLISDTHGLLRPAVLECFAGVDRILHAGDIGGPDVLVELEAVAPVTAVYGNTDGFETRARVAETARIELDGLRVVLTHGHQLGSPTPGGLRERYPDADLVVYGHTHRALVDRTGSPAVVNPGAAGHARFEHRPSIGLLTTAPSGFHIDIIEI